MLLAFGVPGERCKWHHVADRQQWQRLMDVCVEREASEELSLWPQPITDIDWHLDTDNWQDGTLRNTPGHAWNRTVQSLYLPNTAILSYRLNSIVDHTRDVYETWSAALGASQTPTQTPLRWWRRNFSIQSEEVHFINKMCEKRSNLCKKGMKDSHVMSFCLAQLKGTNCTQGINVGETFNKR